MHFAMLIPDWNSLDSVRAAHSDLEVAALAFFALLVLFDVLAHLSKHEARKMILEKIALGFFAVAVLAEIVAYPYGHRNDKLSGDIIVSLSDKAKTALADSEMALTNSGTALTKSGEAIAKAEAATDSAGSAQRVASAAKTSAVEAQAKIALVSKQAVDTDAEMKLALSMLSARKVRDPKRMKALVAQYAQWPEPVVIKSYIGDLEGFWTCLYLSSELLTPAPSPGGLKVTGQCGGEPMPSEVDRIEGIEMHAGSSSYENLLEQMNLLEILRGDGGLGVFSDSGGEVRPEFPKDHIEVIVGVNPRFSLERLQYEQESIKKQTTK
jgi:hypothetical protein